ncbi:hypothetical protein Tcan_00156 [Toxocara canis]|uniref:Uncharacterized protein n=1 Tax=Toxocara canis TaxID=6265 RepID=A0A0B2W2M1_TOXCA|nr:hypothetical protein Tcan_00156 [Toxocara canis]
MESARRRQDALECSQTWTIAFAVSLVFTVVFGILLILYCIMYRKHIKFLLKGPPPVKTALNLAAEKLPAESMEIESGNTSSHLSATDRCSAISSCTSATTANTTAMTTTGITTTNQNMTGTTNQSNVSMVSQC